MALALEMLLQTPRMNRFLLRDAIVNVSMYVPLGAAAYLAFQSLGRYGAAFAATAIGTLLSLGVEITQFYTPLRMPSLYDVLFNAIGTLVGVMIAIAAHSLLPQSRLSWSSRHDRVALALLCCGLAYLLFPFFPLLSQTGIARKFAIFTFTHSFSTVPFLSSALAWFIGGYLFLAGTRASRSLFPVALITLPAQFFVLGRQPLPSIVLGALVGVVLFILIPAPRWPFVAAAAVAVLAIRGLEPFQGQIAFYPANSFTLTPFGGALAADWQAGLMILIEKTFFYGITLWALTRAGFRLWTAVALVAAVTAFTEIAQIYMPGRTPEITDPILTLFIGYTMRALQRWQSPVATVRHVR